MRSISVASSPILRMFDTGLLPPADAAFRWIAEQPGAALAAAPLEPFAHHLVTTREWGLGRPNNPEAATGWDEVAEAIGVPADRLVRARQVHGTAVIVCRPGVRRPP